MVVAMGMEFETKGKRHVDIHYVDGPVKGIVEEAFESYYHEHNAFTLQEFIQDQDANQSYQKKTQIDQMRASSSNDTNHDNGPGSIVRLLDFDKQLVDDEALARYLQEEEFASSPVAHPKERESGPSGTRNEQSSASTSQGTFISVEREDDVDPDNMTYEELRLLAEDVGTESRGLSDEVISYLPTEKYKIGFFSRKEKHDECAICLETYKNREKLIKLPCKHYYHSSCVTQWLRSNKACPVCKVEVFGS